MNMGLWQEEALRRFSELSDRIREAESPYQLWDQLLFAFEDAYDSENTNLIAAIYGYARWCCEQPRGISANDDLATCVTVCFFEHIPDHPKALQDMPRWWSLEEVKAMKDVFSHHVGADGYARFVELYAAQQGAGGRRA
jgi:hypothetical protein